MADDFLCMGRFLGLTCLAARGFLGLTAFQAEGCGSALRAQIIKKGARLRRRLCRRVVHRFAQGGDSGSATEGGGLPLCGNAYKVSVTGLAFCITWHDKHSGDWLTAFATPFPTARDFPRKREQNKTPRDNLLINPPLEMTVAASTPLVI